MCALPAKLQSAIARSSGTANAADRRTLLFVGVPTFVLLIFTTVTVFVRDAWALQLFQAGTYALLALYMIAGSRKGKLEPAGRWTAYFVYLIPLWGMLQIAAHTTASSIETREAVLRWGSLAALFFLSQLVGRSAANRHIALHAILYFAVAMAILCMAELFTSQGKAFWVFPTGYPFVYATFAYSNNYAQFVELALPIALWWTLQGKRYEWAYALAVGVLYASVIGSASRAGTALCTAELLFMLGIGLLWALRHKPGWSLRSITNAFALVLIVAAFFTFAVGWQQVWVHFKQGDPYSSRKDFLVGDLDMVEHRPFAGYGLDTFPEVYQQHATSDNNIYANHAHNDWAEFTADGGVPFLLLVLIPFTAALPVAIRHPWGLGLVSVMLHACVDYPFPRPAVSGWLFAMLALLYMADRTDRETPRPRRSSPGRSNLPSGIQAVK